MALRYMLDTNVLSDLVRAPQGAIASRLLATGEDTVCTSIVVAAELRYGAAKSGSAELERHVDLVLSALQVLSLEPPVDRAYARIRHELARAGRLIGPNDLLIAAHAHALELTIVTEKEREFSRVEGLRVVSWRAS